jgi:hypothetical protein
MSNVVRHVLVADADEAGVAHATEALAGVDVESVDTPARRAPRRGRHCRGARCAR